MRSGGEDGGDHTGFGYEAGEEGLANSKDNVSFSIRRALSCKEYESKCYRTLR